MTFIRVAKSDGLLLKGSSLYGPIAYNTKQKQVSAQLSFTALPETSGAAKLYLVAPTEKHINEDEHIF